MAEFKDDTLSYLNFSPYQLEATEVFLLSKNLQNAFVMFSPENNTTDVALKYAWALFSRCSFYLNKELRQKYRVLLQQFEEDIKAYNSGLLPYDEFFDMFAEYNKEFQFMKFISGFRIGTKERVTPQKLLEEEAKLLAEEKQSLPAEDEEEDFQEPDLQEQENKQ